MTKHVKNAPEDHQAHVDGMAAMVAQVHKDYATQARRHSLAGRVALEARETDPAFATSFDGHLDNALVLPAHRQMFDLPKKQRP